MYYLFFEVPNILSSIHQKFSWDDKHDAFATKILWFILSNIKITSDLGCIKRQRKFGSAFIISRKAIDLKKRICRPYSSMYLLRKPKCAMKF